MPKAINTDIKFLYLICVRECGDPKGNLIIITSRSKTFH
jgi:hypothetical protein